jgi:transcription termination factor NusB
VHRDDAYANIVLPRLLRENRITGRDAALATELTYGTLRSLGQLDAIIASAANRAVDRIDPPARDALRLGAYQLLHTRVPPHAAVSTTVDLVRLVAPGAIGFANAVLRRITAISPPGLPRSPFGAGRSGRAPALSTRIRNGGPGFAGAPGDPTTAQARTTSAANHLCACLPDDRGRAGRSHRWLPSHCRTRCTCRRRAG